MEIDKIEILVEKIDQAIRIIDNLKSENSSYAGRIEDYERKINLLEKENIKLKEISSRQKEEIEKNNSLHKKLEDKIQLILNHLPGDASAKKSVKESAKKEKSDSFKNSEEENLRRFAENPSSIEKKGLFTSESKDDLKAIFEKGNIENDNLKNDYIKDKPVEIKYSEGLNPEIAGDEVEFYLDDDESEKQELPRGVL